MAKGQEHPQLQCGNAGQRDDSHPGHDKATARFHATAQNCVQCKTYEVLISGIFHLIFSDCH